jgi:transcriptional regulator with XRE-family HTH domain
MDRSLGERIATWRRERGMSQAALAAATGVSRSAVAQWETDRAGQVSGNLSRIAQALDVSVEMLLHGSEGLTGDEMALLRLYRLCGVEARAEVLRLARRSARDAGEPDGVSGV